jgi:hypothetical protein
MPIRVIGTQKPVNFTWDTAPKEYFWITIGSYYDRFGSAKIPVLSNEDPTVKAMIKDIEVRQYVDLKRGELLQAMQYVATKVPELTGDIINKVLNPVTNPKERYVEGLRQPFMRVIR